MKLFKLIGLLSLYSISLCAEESTITPLIKEEQVILPILSMDLPISEVSIETPVVSILPMKTDILVNADEAVPLEQGVIVSDTSVKPSSLVVKNLLSQVQNAPDIEKRVLMNQLKIQLKKMNKETRQKAMKVLKKSFSSHQSHQPQHQEHQYPNQEACQEYLNHQGNEQHINHQPKFRHLQQGLGQGDGSGAGHQGNGLK